MFRRAVKRVIESTDPVSELGSRWRAPVRRIRDAVDRIHRVENVELDHLATRLWESTWSIATAAGTYESSRPGLDLGRLDVIDLTAATTRPADETWKLLDDLDEGLRAAAGGAEEAAAFANGLPGLRDPDPAEARARLEQLNADVIALGSSFAAAPTAG